MSELSVQGDLVRRAARSLAQATNDQRCAVLERVADRLDATVSELLELNAAEVEAYEESGPGRDRLTLTETRVAAMSQASS